MGGRGDWNEWTTRLGAKQLSATLLKIMVYCDFGKRGFGKEIYRMNSCLSLQSRAYFDLATGMIYGLNLFA